MIDNRLDEHLLESRMQEPSITILSRRLPKRCSICLRRKPMTKDHLFPTGLIAPGTRVVRDFLHSVSNKPQRKSKSSITQNGLKKSNICGDCNNKLLGARLDPALIELYEKAKFFCRNLRFIVGHSIKLENVQLKKACRAVLAHMIAFDDEANYGAPYMKDIRRFIFRDDFDLPAKYSIYIWVYPYDSQSLTRNIAALQSFGTEATLFFSSYKTFPLGFLFGLETGGYKVPVPGMVEISRALIADPEKRYNICLPIGRIPPENWPEAPQKNGALATGGDPGVSTHPYVKKKAYPY